MSGGREALIRCFGTDPIAYSTLQANLEYFDTSFGYIAYRKVMGAQITLGPPVCANEDRKEILKRFLSYARRPILCYLPQSTLLDLEDSRLCCTGMGVDRYVDTTSLLSQPAKEVRGALKKARKVNFHLKPLDFTQVAASDQERLETISRKFLKQSQCSVEMSFINRPMTYQNDGMRRVFSLNKNDTEHNGMFGYAVLNPYYDKGSVQGYLLDILRFESTKLWGVWLSTVWHIAQLLSEEGHALSLGFCPLYGIEKAPVCSSTWLEAQMRWTAKYLSQSQYVRRLYELKSLIPGWEESRYFASYSPNLLMAFAALIKASGIRLSYLFGPELARSLIAGWSANNRKNTSC
jgi:lysylphosphatidylglycerol synthetase-like protein (DUF2156 family)